MELTKEKVTPAKAERWLNSNKSNRKLREGVAEKYAEDMKNGRWTMCPVPISFYDDGDVADGQHRLFAIVESGIAVEFPIARGLPREAGLNIDTGLGRSLVDNARISGKDKNLSATLISAARAIADGQPQTGGRSNASKLEVVEAHREAAAWVTTNMRRHKFVCSAPVMGAVGRAWYVETDKAKLKRFCDVLGSGFADGATESAAVSIRNYLIAKGTPASSHAMWRDTFLKAQNAIRYFMRGKALTIVKVVSDEAYPLKATKKVK